MSVTQSVFDHSRHNGNQRDATNRVGVATQRAAVPLVPEVAVRRKMPWRSKFAQLLARGIVSMKVFGIAQLVNGMHFKIWDKRAHAKK